MGQFIVKWETFGNLTTFGIKFSDPDSFWGEADEYTFLSHFRKLKLCDIGNNYLA